MASRRWFISSERRLGTYQLSVFLASDPDLIQQVLVTDAKHYIKHFGAQERSNQCLAKTSSRARATWLRQRRLLQPAFLKARVLSYAPVMTGVTQAILERWSPGKSVDVAVAFSALTSAIALKTLFGLDDYGDRERMDHSLRLAFDLMTARLDGLLQLPIWLPTPANLRLRQAIAELDRVVEGVYCSRPRAATPRQ